MSLKTLSFAIESTRCPDGVSVDSERFKFRTDRREPVRLEITDLTDPVIIRFINARTDAAMCDFLGRFGFVLPTPPVTPRRESVADYQQQMRELVATVGGGDLPASMIALNHALGLINITPLNASVDLAGDNGGVRLVYSSNILLHYMLMEAVTIATHGARLAFCKHCGAAFLTGHLTGRRSHAEYCSDRCRAAAQRERKAKGSV